MHGRNFPARCLQVNQHGAILGMQMHRNRAGPTSVASHRHSGAMRSIEPGISRFPDVRGSLRAPERRKVAAALIYAYRAPLFANASHSQAELG